MVCIWLAFCCVYTESRLSFNLDSGNPLAYEELTVAAKFCLLCANDSLKVFEFESDYLPVLLF